MRSSEQKAQPVGQEQAEHERPIQEIVIQFGPILWDAFFDFTESNPAVKILSKNERELIQFIKYDHAKLFPFLTSLHYLPILMFYQFMTNHRSWQGTKEALNLNNYRAVVLIKHIHLNQQRITLDLSMTDPTVAEEIHAHLVLLVMQAQSSTTGQQATLTVNRG